MEYNWSIRTSLSFFTSLASSFKLQIRRQWLDQKYIEHWTKKQHEEQERICKEKEHEQLNEKPRVI